MNEFLLSWDGFKVNKTQWQTTVSSEEVTRQLAHCLADIVKAPITICLIGDLGTGKTSFVRAFAERRKPDFKGK